MLISSSEALNQIMQHVGRVLNVEYEQVRVNLPETNDNDTQKDEHLKSYEWDFWQKKDPYTVFPQVSDADFVEDNLAKVAAAFVESGAVYVSRTRLTFDDIWPYVKSLFGSGVVIGLINGKPVDNVSLASRAYYDALLRGDEVTMPVRSKSVDYMRQIKDPLIGPLLIDADELETALTNSEPEFEVESEPAPEPMNDRADAGGMKNPPLRIAVALGHYVLTATPDIGEQGLFEEVQKLWDEASGNSDGKGSPRYLKGLLDPLWSMSELKPGAKRAEAVQIARKFYISDEDDRQKRNRKRQPVRNAKKL